MLQEIKLKEERRKLYKNKDYNTIYLHCFHALYRVLFQEKLFWIHTSKLFIVYILGCFTYVM